MRLSIVVIVYNMAREAPRTLLSLSAAYQRGVRAEDYEVIVVDNGSKPAFDARLLEGLAGNFRLIRVDDAKVSPVAAINRGIAAARGDLVGVMIDGARIASPGIVSRALEADKLGERTLTLTLGFHLGPDLQVRSVAAGYDQKVEDRLLEEARWTEDGYRLFGISVFAASSRKGWFKPLNESNALFMPKALWQELGGFDERFQSPGGGFANLDMLARAVQAAGTIVTLLGEGTFHQVHGGVATNARERPVAAFRAEYRNIRGHDFRAPDYRSLYLGTPPSSAAVSRGIDT
jgi:glycosyltransferase involved in cell wall biosynthesis